MFSSLYRTQQFKKSLSALHKAGGEAGNVARRVEVIIDRLVQKGCARLTDLGRLTRHGERRSKDCMKFDLGSGYRLIFTMRSSCFVFLFIGTHDECDRWIKRNKKIVVDVNNQSTEAAATMNLTDEDVDMALEIEEEIDYDELMLEKIDDRILRRVFKALCCK